MHELAKLVRDQTQALQREYGFVLSNERSWGVRGGSPNGAQVWLSNNAVQIEFLLDSRISHIEVRIGLVRHGDDVARRYPTDTIVRFANGNASSELRAVRPGVDLQAQLKAHLDVLVRYGKQLMTGDEKAFELLYEYSRGYYSRYTEEMSQPHPSENERKPTRGSRIAVLIAGGVIGALMVLIGYGHLRL